MVFGRTKGIGIGIIQSAATDATQSNTLLREEHKHGIERGQVGAQNVQTRERAHMFALVLATGLARSTLKRQYAAARIKVQSVTVLCSLPAVVEVIKQHRACGTTKSLESVVSTEDRSMLRRVLAGVRRLSRCDVQVSVVGYGAEGDTVDAARVDTIARHRKKVCRRRRHERRIMLINTETAGDEREDGGSDEEERDGAVDREEGRSDGSHWERGTGSSSAIIMYETGEPEQHKLKHTLLILVL